jgi:hypothetical protein
MKHDDKVKTIQFLRPNASWSLMDDDLQWFDEEQIKPTDDEIKAGWVAYQAAEKSKLETKIAAKAAAQAKLAALGLTVEDLKALGL